MVRNYIRTIQDLEDIYYGGIIGSAQSYITKADAPIISTTTGVWQQLYGAKCWINMNLAANTFGIIPKKPWLRSGWRAITARASDAVNGGVAENATLPDTIQPTFAQISTKPKQVVHNFNTSELMQFLGTVDDSLDDVMSLMREYMAKEHAEQINKMLNTQNGTLASNNIESVDRVLGSNSELVGNKDSAGAVYSANDLDIYGLDRDAGAAWHDAYVNHNSGVMRPLTLTQIDTLYQNVWTNGGQPKVMLTGYDTLMKIQQLLQTQQRWVETTNITPGVNGIQGVPGVKGGFIVATYNGVPIIPEKNMTVDTGGISRIELLDTDYLWLETAKPTQYFESGMLSGDPFGINYLGQEGMYRTMAEIKCMFFKAQAKGRDYN